MAIVLKYRGKILKIKNTNIVFNVNRHRGNNTPINYITNQTTLNNESTFTHINEDVIDYVNNQTVLNNETTITFN